MFEIIRIPAFKDNYIWLLRKGASAIVVDPGDATPVLAVLAQEQLSLAAILVTHHHHDHQGGIGELRSRFSPRVYGPAAESITGLTHPLLGGETIVLDVINAEFQVLAVPGHTLGHLAYVGHGVVFCGDTLFAGGCGRVFEGTALQMCSSLNRLAALPEDTQVYCAHEYTENNLRFALSVEPGNRRLRDRVDQVAVARAKRESTVPSSIAIEKATNPFLRCSVPEVAVAAREHGAQSTDPVAVFTALRAWKNEF